MDNNEMSEMIKKAQEMINNNQIPDELKSFVSNMQDANGQEQSTSEQMGDGLGVDMETLMKIQNVMSKMKSNDTNDDMSKLLMSLKPYLRDDRKGKIDEYVKLIKMGKLTKMFGDLQGDKS